MIESIQITNKNGDSTFTEGISYIEITSTGKKYLFYTLNEKVDNELTKIYISETADKLEDVNQISQEEWDDLRKKMVKISHKETLEDVKFLSMSNKAFNVGEPKKLAVTTVAKQSFKDAQTTHTLSTDTNNEAVFNNTSFYNSNVVETVTENPINSDETSSIFASPPQPIIQNTEINTEYSLPSSEVLDSSKPISPAENTSVSEEDKTVDSQIDNTVSENKNSAEEQTQNIDEQIISDEEALKAIEIIQEYLDREVSE